MKRPSLLTATSWLIGAVALALACGDAPLTHLLGCLVAALMVALLQGALDPIRPDREGP